MECCRNAILTTTILLLIPEILLAEKESWTDAPKEHYQGGLHNAEFDHESVLGSKKLHEQFEHLLPEEAKKRLGIMVDHMDLNNDGSITKEELVKWIAHSFRRLDREEAQLKLPDYDTDQSRYLSWSEYLGSVYGYKPSDLYDMEHDKNPDIQTFAKMVEDDRNKFKMADRDADGQLSSEEFSAFLHPYNYDYMEDYELDRIMAEYDKNNDSVIDFMEYIGDVTGNQEKFVMDKDNFASYDTNNDGRLSRQEAKSWVIPDLSGSAIDEAEHLLSETDFNKDGKLSKQEIIDNHFLWVGSAATNYGSHLHTVTHDGSEL